MKYAALSSAHRLQRILEVTERADVQYLLISVYAVGYHGYPRATADMDGVDFDECYAERVSAEIDGERVNIISRQNLRRNKKAVARYKDLDDLENLPEDF